jgi:3-oxoacyl-[acyl-carrier protein] reductase
VAIPTVDDQAGASSVNGRFDGRIALITGAGSPTGIGFSTARLFGREGARVAIASTTERIHERVAELAADGIAASGHVGNLTRDGVADRIVAEALAAHGRLDILVNSAGMTAVGEPETDLALVDTSEAEWDRVIALNLRTAFSTTRAALAALLEASPGARIVYVSSVTGPLVSNPRSSGYAAAKAGLTGLARSLAVELGRQGITVNCVLPGWIASGSHLPEEAIAGANTPIGRSGSVDEVAEAIAFLASPGASYITGQTLVVDGGNVVQEYKGPPEGYY